MLQINWMNLFFSVKGRINRQIFWVGFIILAILLAIIEGLVFLVVNPSDVAAVALFAPLILIYPYIAIFSKRQHDRGRSAWWLLIALTVVGALWLILDSGIYEGENNENPFGPSPINS